MCKSRWLKRVNTSSFEEGKTLLYQVNSNFWEGGVYIANKERLLPL